MISVIDSGTASISVAFIAIVPATIAAINAWRAKRESLPNGGSSQRDAVDRIEATVTEMMRLSVENTHAVGRLADRLDSHESRLASIEAHVVITHIEEHP